MEDRTKKLEEEIRRLQEENDSLRAEVHQWEDGGQPFVPDITDDYGEFVSNHGVLWTRAADGGLEKVVYCPECRLVLLPLPSDNPSRLVCTGCQFKAPFGPAEIERISEGL